MSDDPTIAHLIFVCAPLAAELCYNSLLMTTVIYICTVILTLTFNHVRHGPIWFGFHQKTANLSTHPPGAHIRVLLMQRHSPTYNGELALEVQIKWKDGSDWFTSIDTLLSCNHARLPHTTTHLHYLHLPIHYHHCNHHFTPHHLLIAHRTISRMLSRIVPFRHFSGR